MGDGKVLFLLAVKVKKAVRIPNIDTRKTTSENITVNNQ